VFAPDAVSVTGNPSQTSVVEVAIEIIGEAFTVTVTAATLVLVHPAVLVPVTEYDPVIVGTKGVPSTGPPVHV